MPTQRRSIKHERPLLVEAYLRRAIPIDQYEMRADELRDLTTEWNQRTGRTDAPVDVFHYMRTQRKRGLWVKLGEQHETPPPPPTMTPEEVEQLVAIYEDHVADLANGSDTLGYDPEIANIIANEFSATIGRIIPANECIAKITALRKRGRLPKAAQCPKDDSDEIGFEDINQVG